MMAGGPKNKVMTSWPGTFFALFSFFTIGCQERRHKKVTAASLIDDAKNGMIRSFL
jgi:hypothetical protein